MNSITNETINKIVTDKKLNKSGFLSDQIICKTKNILELEISTELIIYVVYYVARVDELCSCSRQRELSVCKYNSPRIPLSFRQIVPPSIMYV